MIIYIYICIYPTPSSFLEWADSVSSSRIPNYKKLVLSSIRAFEGECAKCTVGTFSEQVAAIFSDFCSNCPRCQTSPAATYSVAKCTRDSDYFQLNGNTCVYKTGLGDSPACILQDGFRVHTLLVALLGVMQICRDGRILCLQRFLIKFTLHYNIRFV